MSYKLDFPDSIIDIASKYVEQYYRDSDIRMGHKQTMNTLFDLGKTITLFKQLADCIETIMWKQDQVDMEDM
jgi:hypothetical protein